MTVDEALRNGQVGLLEAALRRVSFESTLPSTAGQQAQQTLHDFKQNLLSAQRRPALSATFYVASPEELITQVDAHLHQGKPASRLSQACPKILIAPHAGHVYSGDTAGKAYALLAPHAAKIRRVVLFGPAHRVYFQGIALPGAGSFETPLGAMPLDTLGFDAIADLPFISTRPDAHAQEHCLEVHVPFLQRALPQASLVPLLVGDAPREAVAQVMQRLWGDAETVFIISTDLSHFHRYDEANAIDAATCTQILALDPRLNHEQACGATPVNGTLLLAQERSLRIAQIERLNSGDTAGNSPEGRERVVGYASFALFETHQDTINSIASRADSMPARGHFSLKNASLNASQGMQLVKLARQQLQQHIAGDAAQSLDLSGFQQLGASFVTLTKQGQLRGCIGSLQAHRPLAHDVQANALAAALHDPRFPPVTAQELPQIQVEVSVLTAPTALPHANESHALWQLRPGIDGLIFEALHNGQHYRSTYLPQVWEQIPEPRAFLAHLKVKAGLPFDFWSPDVKLSRYEVQKFHE
jgi:MEMO1 family protein